MFNDLFSMAPMLKSSTATMLNNSKSYSRPNTSSSHFMDLINDVIACSHLSKLCSSTKMRNVTFLPVIVVNLSSIIPSSPATSANKYAGLAQGSSHTVKCLPSPASPESIKLPLDNSTGYLALSAVIFVVKMDITSGLSW